LREAHAAQCMPAISKRAVRAPPDEIGVSYVVAVTSLALVRQDGNF
jgi:hypothetical protein